MNTDESNEVSPPKTDSTKSRYSELFYPLIIAFAVVFLLGMLTPIRIVAATSIVSMGVVALLPFAIVAIGLFLVLVSVIVFLCPLLLLLGGGGAPNPADGIKMTIAGVFSIPMYYDWILHKKRTWLWGVMLGISIGSGVLSLIVTLHVIPGETSTAMTLIEVGERMQQVQVEAGKFPEPDADGHLRWEQLFVSGESPHSTGVINDAFGRSIQVRVEEFEQGLSLSLNLFQEEKPEVYRPGSFERFTLTSRGFGLATPYDDIVHTGVWEKAEPMSSDSILGALGNLALQKGKASVSQRFDALKELRSREKKNLEESK